MALCLALSWPVDSLARATTLSSKNAVPKISRLDLAQSAAPPVLPALRSGGCQKKPCVTRCKVGIDLLELRQINAAPATPFAPWVGSELATFSRRDREIRHPSKQPTPRTGVLSARQGAEWRCGREQTRSAPIGALASNLV